MIQNEAQRLSKLLWDSREAVEMLADITRAGAEDNSLRRLVAEIDAYRVERGWSRNGFGGEAP